ncbi:MAG: nucleotide exchange factor GrpE [Clostridia bacterium]|nr:nucleotide exchange factor GrpE [Clostridia bacterium]
MAEDKKTKTEETAKTESCEKKEKKKTTKKDSEIEALKKELQQKSDLLTRTAAEFDNFKKRTEREKSGIAEFAKADVIKKLLPIMDNIERANAADKDSPDYIKGIEMIVKQFTSLSETLGIEEIGSEGEKFDPNFHEAVMHIEDENFGENEIALVLQKGFKLGDTVIRPAMVKVAN